YYHSIDEIFRTLRAAYLARRARYLADEAAIFERILARGESAGAFELDDPAAMAATLLLATNGLLPSNLSPRELGARQEAEARRTKIASLLLKGLRRVKRQSHAKRRARSSNLEPAG